MASVVSVRAAQTRIFLFGFLLLGILGFSVAVSLTDDDYNKYEISHKSSYKEDFPPAVEFKFLKLEKRSALDSHIQPPPRSDNSTAGNLSNHTETVNKEVVRDKEITNNSTVSKTGGNYQASSPTTAIPSPDDKAATLNKTSSSKAKLSATLDQLDKNRSNIDNAVKQAAAAGGLLTSLPEAKPTEPSKSDGKAWPKKVESETKAPKTEPTKKPIGEDKTSKKAAADEKLSKSTTTNATSTPNSESTDEESIQIDNFPEEVSNKTLQEHNLTLSQDQHLYYNSSFVADNAEHGLSYWVNMTGLPGVHVNDLLSQSHRRAATVRLSFDFPFYGHMVRNVTVATGGFLYTGDYVHSWLAATQYIAPLMANFDTSLSNQSFIRYMDNGTAFTVQWEKVLLQDKPKSGDFTFQVTLHKNGDIVFVYRNVPVIIKTIQDDHHPVKVGLSDAYIIDRTIFFVRRKTIYEYHRVNFEKQDIKNWTVIYLNAVPTCLEAQNCSDCLTRDTGFNCTWCPGSSRCSTGMDRHRQEWMLKGCDRGASIAVVSQCLANDSSHAGVLPSSHGISTDHSSQASKHSQSERESGDGSMGVSGIIGILFLVALVGTAGVWLVYSYRNPTSASGQFLIKYRPSTWSWRRGEARYTAATIHM